MLDHEDGHVFNFKISEQKSGRQVGTFTVKKGEKFTKSTPINSRSNSSSKSSGSPSLLQVDTDNGRN